MADQVKDSTQRAPSPLLVHPAFMARTPPTRLGPGNAFPRGHSGSTKPSSTSMSWRNNSSSCSSLCSGSAAGLVEFSLPVAGCRSPEMMPLISLELEVNRSPFRWYSKRRNRSGSTRFSPRDGVSAGLSSVQTRTYSSSRPCSFRRVSRRCDPAAPDSVRARQMQQRDVRSRVVHHDRDVRVPHILGFHVGENQPDYRA